MGRTPDFALIVRTVRSVTCPSGIASTDQRPIPD
jgi:hypothetical protein